MKKLLTTFSFMFIFCAVLYAQSPTLTIPVVPAPGAGQQISVPINVTNLNNIGAVTLKIQYDPTVVQFQSVSRSGEFLAGASGGVITIARAALTAVTPSNGKLLDLNFTYTGGSTNLTFNTADCELAPLSGLPIPGVYVNGGISNTLICASVKLDTVTAAAVNSKLTVPLSVTEFNNIGAITLKIDYNPAVVRYDSLSRANEFIAGANNGRLVITRAALTPVTPANGKMLDIYFTYLGGTTNLTFVEEESEIAHLTQGPLSCVNYLDGIVLLPVPTVPSFNSVMPNSTVAEGSLLTFDYNASDVDGDTLNYSLLAGNPAGASINANTGVFSWTPGYDQAGNHNILVRVTDGTNNITDTAAVTVTNTNRSPSFNSVMPNSTVAENNLVTFDYNASDPDGGNIVFSLAPGSPAGAVIDTITGIFTWTPDYSQAGSHNILVGVSDGAITVLDTSVITVTNSNRSPAFSAVMPNSTVAENSLLSFDYNATDPDNDGITFSLPAGNPAGASINAASGAFTWTPGYTQAGTHNIYVKISDGTGDITDTASVTVTNTNRSPVFTDTLANIVDGAVGVEITFTYKADDPDSDNLVYKIVEAPEGAAIDSLTGEFSYTPAVQDTVDVTVSVSDGSALVTTTASIEIITSIRTLDGIPDHFDISQNYPNPFNPSTVIRISIPVQSQVKLAVYNMLGEQVASVVNEELSAGYHEYTYDASSLSSGIYLYRVEAADFVSAKKMILIK